MEIGIIQTGKVRDRLVAAHGEYPGMFERLLRPHLPQARFRAVALVDGEALPAPGACDGWVVTGSRHGVYDDLPWIEPLKAWLRQARAARVPLIGVCFGHQIMAEAFGGRAVKHAGGWRIGASGFERVAAPGWAGAVPRAPRLHSLHQDQVVADPPGATRWLTAPGCASAALIYGDAERPEAISVQPHPEFNDGFTGAITDYLEELETIGAAQAEAARASLGGATDDAALGAAFAAYLTRMSAG